MFALIGRNTFLANTHTRKKYNELGKVTADNGVNKVEKETQKNKRRSFRS